MDYICVTFDLREEKVPYVLIIGKTNSGCFFSLLCRLNVRMQLPVLVPMCKILSLKKTLNSACALYLGANKFQQNFAKSWGAHYKREHIIFEILWYFGWKCGCFFRWMDLEGGFMGLAAISSIAEKTCYARHLLQLSTDICILHLISKHVEIFVCMIWVVVSY